MSDEVVIRHCAPTLASIKTGSLFTSRFASLEAMRESLRRLNRRIRSKGLRVIPLRYREGVGLIYLYRPKRLCADLLDDHTVQLLSQMGYPAAHPEGCLRRLAARLSEAAEFPHEIGLFLSYPPEDVDGFIENKADRCKLVGCWKVYGDVDSAQKLFAKYKKCTEAYATQLSKGRSIERLAVAG